MKRAQFTAMAEADLGDIAYFIARDNPERAVTFVDEIIAHCHRIAALPALGRDRVELGRDIRSMPHDRYIIFYRIVEAGIEIVRVLHSARDIGTVFDG
ncbi:MAG: type II toxin-antitoxin system RelE/ParE family toxin [Alphaproteobacteria bacterium]|nr:type II toxin-antitoxin system RelE/ParE family toxin [Alphaproteobacteria bacterium]